MIRIVSLYDQVGLGRSLGDWLTGRQHPARVEDAEIHTFPDGEIRLRLTGQPESTVIVVCTLDRPSEKTLALVFASELLRQQGATRILLVAPYLAYMRQDIAFQPGEGVSAASYARLLSAYVDGLITVDPHLHRIPDLEQVYRVPSQALHATGILGDWLRQQLDSPALLIGPDRESEQWVTAVAADCGQAFLVLDKERFGDRHVEIAVPDLRDRPEKTVVLVDDMVSTGHTLMKVAQALRTQGFSDIRAVCVHALYGAETAAELTASGIIDMASCNTVAHPSNRLDVTALIGNGVLQWLG